MASYFKKASNPGSVLIKNARFIITEHGIAKRGSIQISHGRIKAIGKENRLRKSHGKAEEEIDATNCLVIPGLINTHSHMAMSILRGYAEDLPLYQWLKKKIWPAEARFKPKHIQAGAALSAVEALLSGTTCIMSMYFYNKGGDEANALYNIGMRGTLTHVLFDWTEEEGLAKTKEFVRLWHGKDNGRIRIATAPHAPYSCGPDLLKKIEELRMELNEKYGRKYRILNTIHVAEAPTEAKDIKARYGVSTSKGVATYLKSLKVLTNETVAAHCVHLTNQDFKSLKEISASIASCPISNLKIGVGVANISKVISYKINVSLGTDGPSSNNSLDMFETIKTASLLQKGIHGKPELMKAEKVFQLATLNGAKSLHQERDIGSIRVGKLADLVIIDLSGPNSMPIFDPHNHIAFSAKSNDVRDVFVGGKIIVRNRQVRTIDMQKLKSEIDSTTKELGILNS